MNPGSLPVKIQVGQHKQTCAARGRVSAVGSTVLHVRNHGTRYFKLQNQNQIPYIPIVAVSIRLNFRLRLNNK